VSVPPVLDGVPREESPLAGVVVAVTQQLEPAVLVLLVAVSARRLERPLERACARHKQEEGVVGASCPRGRGGAGLTRGRAEPVFQLLRDRRPRRSEAAGVYGTAPSESTRAVPYTPSPRYVSVPPESVVPSSPVQAVLCEGVGSQVRVRGVPGPAPVVVKNRARHQVSPSRLPCSTDPLRPACRCRKGRPESNDGARTRNSVIPIEQATAEAPKCGNARSERDVRLGRG